MFLTPYNINAFYRSANVVMSTFLTCIRDMVSKDQPDLPFSVYSSVYEQQLLNVPIAKPLLIVVMSGNKALGKDEYIACGAGQFVFLSDNPAIDMRNIPKENEYFALLIEFDYEDFSGIPSTGVARQNYFVGELTFTLEQCLQQFVECAAWGFKEIYASRRKEVLMLLHRLGHSQLTSMMGKTKISHQIHDLFHQQGFQEVTTESICEHLAMSESTLRRKLKSEGTSIQEIKDRAKLGFGLHLLQTTTSSIGLIAEICGYQSQSRFTDRFKSHFGLTPSELRRTKLTE